MMSVKDRAVKLRKEGMTYAEILSKLGTHIPKSTMSYWCRDIVLSDEYVQRVNRMVQDNLQKARKKSVIIRQEREAEKLQNLLDGNRHLAIKIQDNDVAKIALAVLYWGEGGKRWRSGSLYFGNSDERMILFYLKLLRQCYVLNDSKFRCTVQCRADQNIKKLQQHWSKITGIPLKQFYKAQVDKRTIGKPTKQSEYKGVCRVDYLSVELFKDIMQSIKVIANGPLA